MKNYDLIIIGGGAAGMMAAISAKREHPDYSVAILDRTFALGRKILVCGAGRCNITNKNLEKEIGKRFYGAGKYFVKSVFDQFGYQDIVRFFNDLGIELYLERKTDIGKLFPTTNQASTVADLMLDEIGRLGVDVYLNTEVQSVAKNGEDFEIVGQSVAESEQAAHERKFQCKYLILSAGGRTYPALGSNGSGYALAESFGHKIVTPVPSALPLEAESPLCKELPGVRLDAEVTSYISKQAVKTRTDEVMITAYGFSGPAILNISREISIHINREHQNSAEVLFNFLPGYSKEYADKLLEERWSKRPTQSVEKSLYGLLPNKVPAVLLKLAHIAPAKTVEKVSKEERQRLVALLTSYRVAITATRSWHEAEFTAGGVETTELDPHTLESKLCPGLFMCGEILNVDGDVGGFNLSWSWASGQVAGKLRAKRVEE